MEKNYNLWHMLVSFVLGAAIVAGAVLVPSYMGAGFMKQFGAQKNPNQFSATNPIPIPRNTPPSDNTGTCPTCPCTSQISDLRAMISSLLDPYTGKLGERFRDERADIANTEKAIVDLLHPYSGKLADRLNELNQNVNEHANQNWFNLLINLHPYTGKLGQRLTELQDALSR